MKIIQTFSFASGTIQAFHGESQINVVKRCNAANITMQKSLSQQPLSCIKKGWEQQTSNKFEKFE